MIEGCGGQLRLAATGHVVGLDFGAVLSLGAAARADMALLAGVLPAVEAAILTHSDEGDGNGEA